MTSLRPYRHDTGEGAAERAIGELQKGINNRYCPGTVEMFVEMYRTGGLAWILEYFNDTAQVPALNGLSEVAKARLSPKK
jgi:hypothetical protein